MGVLLKAAEVAVHAMAGLGQVGGGVLDGYGQMTQCPGQPSRLADAPLVLFRREPPVDAEDRYPAAQEADGLVLGERRNPDIVLFDVPGPVLEPRGNDDVATRRAGG